MNLPEKLSTVVVIATGLLLSPGVAVAAGSFVQANAGGAPGSSSGFSVPFLSSTAAGDFIIVGFDFKNASVVSVTDSQNNAFVQVGSELSTPGGVHSRVYYAKNIKGGADTISVNLSGSSPYLEEYIAEYSGIDLASPVDAVASNSGPTGNVTSGPATTTVSGDIIYGFCIPEWSCSAGPGFAARLTLFGNLVEDATSGAAGVYAATGSATSAWTMTLVALRPADVTAPSVSLTSPAAGFVAGTIQVAAAASDNVGVAGVQFLLDGSNLGAEDTGAPYATSWLTTGTSNGPHTVTAVARDAAGNIGASSIVVNVNNYVDTTPPVISGGQPNGLQPAGTLQVTLSVTTDENATCRYDVTPGLSYAVMANTFSTTGATAHAAVLSGLASGRNYTYLVRCQDTAQNADLSDYVISFSTAPQAGEYLFPLAVSSNHRYLQDQTGKPFRVHGDAAWDASVDLTLADWRSYLDDRKARGFNTVLVQITEPVRRQPASIAPAAVGANGVFPFLRNAAGGVWDGDPTFTHFDADFSSPNDAYFAWIDVLLQEASARHILVLLAPVYLGNSTTPDGWWPTLNNSANTQAVSYGFGQYLGGRYRNVDNIVWVAGVDMLPPPGSEGEARVHRVMEGIKAAGDTHLWTGQWAHEYLSTDEAAFATAMDIEGVYTHGNYPALGPAYGAARQSYSHSPTLPSVLLETTYEGAHGASAAQIRESMWGAELSAIGGEVFGNDLIWKFSSGWQSVLASDGSRDMQNAGALLNSIAWQALVPSGLAGMKTLVTAGAGSDTTMSAVGEVGGDDHVVAAATPDGRWLLAYVPDVHTGSFAVDMTAMAGLARARWFDPTSGAFATIGTFSNLGTQAFSVPGSNNAGSADWVLVLDLAPPDATPPSVPSGLTATAISASQVNLSWTASVDDVGVSGYRIYRGGVQVGVATSTVYGDTGLSPSTAYSYAVSAFDLAGNASGLSTNAAVTTPAPPDVTAPSTPASVVAMAVSTSQINLSWTASTDNVGVSGYQIYRGGVFVGVAGATSYSDTGLAASTAYVYTVSAFDAAGNVSSPSLGTPATTQGAVPLPGDVVVASNNVHQRIDGFGASDMFGSTLTDAQEDLFFSPTNGIGLSMLRAGITSTGTYSGNHYSNATRAAARGAVVWAAPWSPPGAWKDNGTTTNGGHLLPAFYDAWATRLAAFASLLQQNAGVPLYGVSVQNEPDFVASYDSAIYSNQEMVDFIKVLGPKLAALTPRPKLLTPEVSAWDADLWGFGDAIAADPVASSYTDILATHQYGVPAPTPHSIPDGKMLWETEMSSFEAPTTSIANGITVAEWIHNAIVNASASAWHYWWLVGKNNDNEGLLNKGGVVTKRLYTVGNFSKFIRPGFVRVEASGAPNGVYVSAFKDPSTNAVVIVAINDSGSDVAFGVTLNGITAPSITPWVTSADENLAVHAPLAVAGGRFTTTLPASTVTTFVSGSSLPADTTAPSIPANLTATATSSSQINLAWAASTDDVGVSGYRVVRDGTQIAVVTTTSYVDAGLAGSTTYTYRVAAVDAAGNVSALSTTASATTPTPADTIAPSAPAGLSATAVSPTQVMVTWSASTDNVGVTSYRVVRNGVLVGSPSTTSYSDTGLTAATTYTYSVTAVDAAGNGSAASASAAATTPALPDTTAPTVPTNVVATAVSSTQVTVTWGASTDNVGVSSYRVVRNGVLVGSTSTTSYSDTGLTGATTYTYTVTAVDAAGNVSLPSASAAVTTPAVVVPNAPAFVQVSAGASPAAASSLAVTLAQPTAAGNVLVVGFEFAGSVVVSIADSQGNPFVLAGSELRTPGGGTSRVYYATNIKGGADTVTVTLAGLSSFVEAYVTEYTGVSTLDAVAGQSGGAGVVTSGLATTTTAGDMLYGYCPADWACDPGPGFTARSTFHSNLIEDLVAGAPGVYAATGSATNGWSMHLVALHPFDTTAPTVPTNLVATAVSSTQVTLTWMTSTDNVGVNNYRVMRNGVLVGSTSTTSYSDTGLASATTYTYSVTAVDAAGNGSAASASAAATTPALPDTTAPTVPTSLVATAVSSTQVTLTWMASTDNVGVSNYRVMRNGVVVGSTSVTSYSDTGLAGATTYTYTVTAADVAGNVSVPSANAAVTTPAPPDTTAPTVPTNVAAAAVSPTQVTVTWSASTDNVGVSSYRVVRNGAQVGSPSTTSYSDTGLAAATTYTYSVTAVDAAGNVSVPSASAAVTTPALPDTTAPTVPTNVVATAVSSTQVTVTWSASTDNVGVSSYRVVRNGAQVGSPSTTSYSDTGLTGATTYTYTVAAVDAAGNGSAPSASAAVTTPGVVVPNAPAFVQVSAGASPATASSLAVTLTQPTAAGNALVVGFEFAGTAFVSIADSQGNPFVLAGNELRTPGGGTSRVYYATNIKGGADTVTVTLAGLSSFVEAYVTEYTGVSTLDAVAGQSGGAGAVTSGLATTTTAGDMLYGYCPADWACDPGPGFTARSTFHSNLIEDLVAGAPGAYAATGSATNGWSMHLVALRP